MGTPIDVVGFGAWVVGGSLRGHEEEPDRDDAAKEVRQLRERDHRQFEA
jgi:hypothetical protein